jgi:hypothetical protein
VDGIYSDFFFLLLPSALAALALLAVPFIIAGKTRSVSQESHGTRMELSQARKQISYLEHCYQFQSRYIFLSWEQTHPHHRHGPFCP